MRLKLPRPSRNLTVGLAVVLLLLVSLLVLFVNKSDAPSPSGNKSNGEQASDAPKTSVRMYATGDWIAHDAINAAAKTDSGYEYGSMTEPFKEYFAKSDINFCNVATLAGGEQFGVVGYPSFNAPTSWLDAMHDLGCNLYNTGTNHTNDKGQAPITAQANHLDGFTGILAHAGANRSSQEQNQVRYFDMHGIKFAFVSYSTYSNSPNPNPYSLNRFSEPLVTDQMTEARANADVVIVSMRWGTEYSPAINAAQEEAAQKLADLGADIVLGHGQHVLGPVKRLNGQEGRETVVWYGLGNFLNAQLETEALTGCVAQIDIDIATKKITEVACLPFYQHYDWSAEDAAAERLMNRSSFKIMPLYEAGEYISKSQLNTTVADQQERIRGIVNQYTEIQVIKE